MPERLQRRDIERHDDGTATLHVRRQMNANTRDYSDPKSDAGKRSMSVPKIMRDGTTGLMINEVSGDCSLAPLM